MSADPKPTSKMPPFRAWVAWHPNEGFMPATEDGGVFVSEDKELLRLADDSPHSKRLRKDGWRIVEVEVRAVEEEK